MEGASASRDSRPSRI